MRILSDPLSTTYTYLFRNVYSSDDRTTIILLLRYYYNIIIIINSITETPPNTRFYFYLLQIHITVAYENYNYVFFPVFVFACELKTRKLNIHRRRIIPINNLITFHTRELIYYTRRLFHRVQLYYYYYFVEYSFQWCTRAIHNNIIYIEIDERWMGGRRHKGLDGGVIA